MSTITHAHVNDNVLAGDAQERTAKEAADSLASQLLAEEPDRVDPTNGGAAGGGLLEAPPSADSRYNSVVKKLFTNTETYEITEKCLKWKWICRLDDKVVRPPWYRPPFFSSALLLTTTNGMTRHPPPPPHARARSIAIALVRSCARTLVKIWQHCDKKRNADGSWKQTGHTGALSKYIRTKHEASVVGAVVVVCDHIHD